MSRSISSAGILLCLLLMSLSAHALPEFSVSAQRLNDLLKEAEVQAQSENSTTALAQPILVHGRVRGVGNVRILLTDHRRFHIVGGNTNTTLLQGEARVRSRRGRVNIPVAASARTMRGGDMRLAVQLINVPSARLSPASIRHANFTLRLRRASSKAQTVRHSFSRAMHQPQRSCGTQHAEGSGLFAHELGPIQTNSLKSMSIVVEGDQQLANQVNNLGNWLSEMMNWVDVAFKRDLSLTFETTIVAQPQNYVQNVVLDQNWQFPLHQEMRERRPPQSRPFDIHYLVTGKKGAGDLQNLAGVVPDLGTVCRSKANSLGFTVFWDFDDALTTAHEIGHLLDARHDDQSTGNTGYIMHSGTTNVNQWVEEFSSVSKFEVANYVDAHGSCMKSVGNPGNGGGGGGGDNGGGGDDDHGGGGDDPFYDDPEFSDPDYGELELFLNRRRPLNRRTGRRRNVMVVRALEYGVPAQAIPVAVSCSDTIEGPYSYLYEVSTNRRGRRPRPYRPRQVPCYCISHTHDFSVISAPLLTKGRRACPL